jgi:phage shock protein C
MTNTMNTTKRLERLPEHKVIGGVAAGLAEYFGTDPILIRALLVAGIFLPHFPALLIYVILWIVMPERKFGAMTATNNTTNFSNPNFFMSNYNSNNRNSSMVGGIVLIALGVIFLLDRWLDIDFGDIWPLILVAVGVWLLFRDRIQKETASFINGPSNTPPSSVSPMPSTPTETDTNTL